MDAHSSPSEPFLARRYGRAIVWLRRDLRLDDHAAIAAAAAASERVCLAFVLDPALLRGERTGAPIVQAFFGALHALRAALRERGSDLALACGDPVQCVPELARRLGAGAVFFNEDYEPHAIRRDAAVSRALEACGIAAESGLDHVCFGANEVLTDAGAPYKVYTPYARRWMEYYRVAPRLPYASERALRGRLLTAAEIGETLPVPAPEAWGYASSPRYPSCAEATARERLDEFLAGAAERYARDRDVPALDATSRLSPDLRAGTIGIRTCFALAMRAAQRAEAAGASDSIRKWISELIWREFYQAILAHFPYVDGGSFQRSADAIAWANDERAFEAWCEGRTGYPIVDAAMRQLNATGWMHNRLRMIVASFLTKDLLIDWRWGERYFERRLADVDLAQNNGGWQWAASTGADAAPYFRIFSPVLQAKKFDPDGAFVRRWLPELAGVPDAHVHEPWDWPLAGYTPPIVDHRTARVRALAAYAVVAKTGDRTR